MERKILKSTVITLMHLLLVWAIVLLLIWPMVSLVTYHYPTCLDDANNITWQFIYLVVYSILVGYATSYYYFKAYNNYKK